MNRSRSFRIIESSSAAVRLDAAAAFLHAVPSSSPGHHRRRHTRRGGRPGAGGCGNQARDVRPASAQPDAARGPNRDCRAGARRCAPSSWLGAEAVATRAAFEATRDAALGYFEPVASAPGFPRALAATLQELRLAGVPSAPSGAAAACRPGSRALADAVRRVLRGRRHRRSRGPVSNGRTPDQGAADWRRDRAPRCRPSPHRTEAELVSAAIAGAATVLATVPRGDRNALQALVDMGGVPDEPADRGRRGPGLPPPLSVQHGRAAAPCAGADGSLEFFSAPGEGRECVEIARRVLREARRGVSLRRDGDHRAIAAQLLRPPRACARSCRRAGLVRSRHAPAASGRPGVPGAARVRGRASVGGPVRGIPVARPGASGRWQRRNEEWAASRDEALGRAPDIPADELETEAAETEAEPADADQAVVAGTLRAPWRWERLLVDAVGDRQRRGAVAAAARRPRPRAGAAARRRRARGRAGERPVCARSSSRSSSWVTCAGSRCRSSTSSTGGPCTRDVGRVARTLRGTRAARAAHACLRPPRARRPPADGRCGTRSISTRCAVS